MTEILPVNYRSDILPEYQGTPAGLLLEYHNLDRALGSGPGRQLLIGMCMVSRKALRIPPDFAFILRTAGANMRDNEFRISFAVAVDSILDQRNKRIETLLAPVQPQLDAVKDSARMRIRQRLTPEQQAKYDEIVKELDAGRTRR